MPTHSVSGGGGFGVERVVGVAAGVEGVERCAIVLVEGQAEANAFRQVGIGDEVATELVEAVV